MHQLPPYVDLVVSIAGTFVVLLVVGLVVTLACHVVAGAVTILIGGEQ